MLAQQAPAPSHIQMETTINQLEAELQALKSSQFSSSTTPSSSTLPAQATIPIHMESHQPPLSPPTSTPYTNEPPISIPSTSLPPKDKQVEDYPINLGGGECLADRQFGNLQLRWRLIFFQKIPPV